MGSLPVTNIFDAPTDERREPGSHNVIAAQYPPSATFDSVNSEEITESVIVNFNKAAKAKDYQAIGDLFLEDSYWRDHLCLSWDFHTLKGKDKITSFLQEHDRIQQIGIDGDEPHRAPQNASVDIFGEVKCVTAFINVVTEVGSGKGVLRLTTRDGSWKILTMYTVLREIKGHEEPRGPHRWSGLNEGDLNWEETRKRDFNYESKEPTVLIIGAGQGGLTTAARLKMQGIDALMIDRQTRIGDNWRNRYRRLVLHDPVWYDHLPYMKFPDYWPVFTPKDKLADWFETYVKILELNVWTQTELVSSSWDETKKHWTVTLERQVGNKKETRTFHPSHIIQATGHSGKKNFPTIRGIDSFKGRLVHSSEFPGAAPNSQGKRAIVVGSCNSGHDIAQDFHDHGYDITMVQRSSTCVVSSHSITEIALKALYSEESIPTEDADLLLQSMPAELSKRQNIQLTKIQNENDRETLEGLLKAGFNVDRGPDAAGLMMKYYQRGGGYYIDVGASKLIADGKIKIKQGQEIEEVLPDGLKFKDGTVLQADEIVFATGYQNMRTQARIIFGDQVADKVKDVWGLDEEGEFRTVFRRSGHPGFWFMGGNLALSRYYSHLLALQIKALEDGLATYDNTK